MGKLRKTVQAWLLAKWYDVQTLIYPLFGKRVWNIMSQQMRTLFILENLQREFRQDQVFRSSSWVCITSDYAGDHPADTHYTYAFLCTAYPILQAWHKEIKDRRKQHGLEDVTIAYKKLRCNDPYHRERILPEWFDLANRMIPGRLIAVSVEKSIKSVFAADFDEFLKWTNSQRITAWSDSMKERLFRILHILCYLEALLTHDGVQYLWLTDCDPIAEKENEEQKAQLLRMWQDVAPIYHRRRFKNIGVLIPHTEDKAKFVDDVLSIPDMAAGAITAQLNRMKKGAPLKDEAVEIYKFLSARDVNLKKHWIELYAVPGTEAKKVNARSMRFMIAEDKVEEG